MQPMSQALIAARALHNMKLPSVIDSDRWETYAKKCDAATSHPDFDQEEFLSLTNKA